jgi:hypothetical protein
MQKPCTNNFFDKLYILLLLLGLFFFNSGTAGAIDRKVANTKYGEPSVNIAVDLNRDGKITFDLEQPRIKDEKLVNDDNIDDTKKATDKTHPNLPYRFWVNNDLDVVNHNGIVRWDRTDCDGLNPQYAQGEEYRQKCEQWDEDPEGGESNVASTRLTNIESIRDLEDFSPIRLRIPVGFNSEGYTIKLRASGVSVNLFKSDWSHEGDSVAHKYIFDEQASYNQIRLANGSKGRFPEVLRINTEVPITQEIFDEYFDPLTGEAKFIFEAIARSPSGSNCAQNAENCYLELELSKIDDESFGPIKSRVYMDIHDIKDFYELIEAGPSAEDVSGRYVIEDEFGEGVLQAFHATYDNAPIITVRSRSLNIYDGLFPRQQLVDNYVLQIHGWRMRDSEKTSFSETSFKRMYWSGYKGQMGALHWPTGWFDKPAHVYGAGVLSYVLGNERNYDISEAVARRVGANLPRWLQAKKATGTNIHVVPHSMGNVLVSEALRYGAGDYLTSYAASQAASAAGAYDSNSPDIAHNLQATAFLSCPIDTTFSNAVNPEEAWRCYNIDNQTPYGNTPFDMPPDMYRYDFIERTDAGEPVRDGDGNYIVRHGPTTVSDMGAYPIPAEGVGTPGHYYAGTGAGLRIINLYSEEDMALNAWEFNQLTKPDFAQGDTWNYSNSYLDEVVSYFNTCIEFCDSPPSEPVEVTSTFSSGGAPVLYNEDTAFDILAHAIPARTKSLGQTLTFGEVGGFLNNANMDGFTDSNQDHSAPYHGFYSDNSKENNQQQRAIYWNTVLRDSLRLAPEEYSGLRNGINRN